MNEMLDLLIYSFDNELTIEEKKQLDAALEASPELQEERERMLKMRSLFSGLKVTEDADFTDKVMARLNQKSAERPSAAKVIQLFPRVAAACVVFILLAFTAIYFTEGNFISDTLVGVDSLPIEDAYSFLDY